MKTRISLIAIVLFYILFLVSCISDGPNQKLKEELEKNDLLLSECEDEKEFLTNQLTNVWAVAEQRQNDIGDLIAMLDENIEDQKVDEAMLSELNDKLQKMKDNADKQEQRISGLVAKVRKTEEQAAREKQIYEQLVKELKNLVDSGQADITRLAGKTKIRLAESVLFESGKAEIIKSGEVALSKIGEQLKKFSDRRVMIEGHTDSVPIGKNLQATYASNLELSAARSVAVHQFLRNRVKISETNLAVVAYGSYRPIAANKTDEGRRKNRRVTLTLEPMEN